MSDSENIKIFNDAVSKIFTLLYEDFPSPMDLGPDHFSITSDLEGIPTWQDSDWEPIFYTLIWLTQEGYIRTHGYSHGICQGAVLTQKGLAVLRSIPDSVSGTAPIGEQLSSAVTSGAKDVARGLVEQALSAGIKIILGQ